MFRRLKKGLAFLASTPLHPQWLAHSGHEHLFALLAEHGENGLVLDIGCYDKWPSRYLPQSAHYVGLDYPETADQWYWSRPDIYGDGCRLPILDEKLDVVLLLDVCEHISDTDLLLEEVHRVLKPGARLLMQVPFLYPLHDEPRDFVRYTRHGFAHLAQRFGFIERSCTAVGAPIESSCLLLNIALAKTTLNWMERKNPLCILGVLFAIVIPINNLLARLLAAVSAMDGFMPRAYQVVFEKAQPLTRSRAS